MEAKFSNRVKEVISLSREEALRLGHDYIGTEHLLLGMIREGEGVAVGVLKKLGVPLDELRAESKNFKRYCYSRSKEPGQYTLDESLPKRF
jgi:ATPases with chaperone activity, ATP-binding subunit